jgi:RimJ/RimL family protein N-acetyltransferase
MRDDLSRRAVPADPSSASHGAVLLRDVIEADLPIFFVQQLDEAANWMAAFAAKDPTDRDAFASKWSRILGDERTTVRTIVADGQVAGSVMCWTDEELGTPEVSYWLGREHWGKGIATRALALFLEIVTERPLCGRAVSDNLASLRVLEKCGFAFRYTTRGFASARGAEVDEVVLELR